MDTISVSVPTICSASTSDTENYNFLAPICKLKDSDIRNCEVESERFRIFSTPRLEKIKHVTFNKEVDIMKKIKQ